MKKIITCLSLLAASATSYAAVIFSQDFTDGGTTSTYVSATPNSGQFNAISTSGAGATASITSNALVFGRTATNTATFSRTTDFSPTPSAIEYKFSLTVSNNSVAQTSAAVFQIGSNFGTGNSTESNADTYARFGINLGATAGEFGIRDITNGTSSSLFSGTQTLTWILNNTGSLLNYTAPSSALSTVANDTADLYIGNTLVLNDVAVQTTTQTMTDLKFAFNAGAGTIALDNFTINSIPEPSTYGMLVGGLGLIALAYRRRMAVL